MTSVIESAKYRLLSNVPILVDFSSLKVLLHKF